MRAINLVKVVTEANIGTKIAQDPRATKMLAIAIKHDNSFPRTILADLGPRPTDTALVKAWGSIVDQSLANSNFGDLSKDGKLDQWITRIYSNGGSDFEDITGEGVDAIGAWKALSIRNMLKPVHQDLNKFNTLALLQSTLNNSQYNDSIRKIRNAEELEKAKRNKKEVVLIDNNRFHVAIPINYGACYTFNNQTGHMSNFCTGGSDGIRWFKNYAPDGPLLMITDKLNINDKNGKWQIHAPTGQIVNSTQDQRYSRANGDTQFAKLFPGLLKEIARAMVMKGDEITNASKEIAPPGGYDIRQSVKELIAKFQTSYKSTPGSANAVDTTLRTQPNPEVTNIAEPTQVNNNNQVSDWQFYVAGRPMTKFLQNLTPQQAQQELRNYARTNRIPTGRAYLRQDGGDMIIRI